FYVAKSFWYDDYYGCFQSAQLVLFCNCSSPPRELDAFPTRRSSDLERTWDVGQRGRSRYRIATAFGTRCHGSRRCNTRIASGDRDRKSTRLNSSHVKISYAVFCLKKKIFR